ncbi:hypothetical protein FT663_01112 [Candidozyma haemuli var. vulneris]|nr:hypothetical protein FT662_00412 [[Candida] haemuloni var. vulneris]KAF3994756.1 hypothetical protein FT663_01112 [[Candida] haemuloni var. vulneris]
MDVMMATFSEDGCVMTDHGTSYTELRWQEGEFAHFTFLIELGNYETNCRLNAQGIYNLKLQNYSDAYQQQCLAEEAMAKEKAEAEEAALKKLFREKRLQRQKKAAEEATKAAETTPAAADESIIAKSPKESVSPAPLDASTADTTPEQATPKMKTVQHGTPLDINDLFAQMAKENASRSNSVASTPSPGSPARTSAVSIDDLFTAAAQEASQHQPSTPPPVQHSPGKKLDLTQLFAAVAAENASSSDTLPVPEKIHPQPVASKDINHEDYTTPTSSPRWKPVDIKSLLTPSPKETLLPASAAASDSVSLPSTPTKFQFRPWHLRTTSVAGAFLPNAAFFHSLQTCDDGDEDSEEDDVFFTPCSTDTFSDPKSSYLPSDFPFFRHLPKQSNALLPGDFPIFKHWSQKTHEAFLPEDFPFFRHLSSKSHASFLPGDFPIFRPLSDKQAPCYLPGDFLFFRHLTPKCHASFLPGDFPFFRHSLQKHHSSYLPGDFHFFRKLFKAPQESFLPSDFFKYKELTNEKHPAVFYLNDFHNIWRFSPETSSQSTVPSFGYSTTTIRPSFGLEFILQAPSPAYLRKRSCCSH